MKTSFTQLMGFYVRSTAYKIFGFFFEGSAGYLQWKADCQRSFEAQLASYLNWKSMRSVDVVQQLYSGLAKPSWSHLAFLKARKIVYRKLKFFFRNTEGYQQWKVYRRESKSVQVAAYLRWKANSGEQFGSALLKGVIEEARSIQFPLFDKPVVSVVVPVYNKVEYTLTCLQSIQRHLPQASFEVIVIDDCSTDQTRTLLSEVKGLRLLCNESNMGFLLNCNKAAQEARGEYLLFLNNDTEVQPGWLDELVWTFDTYPEAGLVGSKLLFPNGILQEAGGIIWKDASGANYGRESNPERPEFCYVREPDYCSGASIMIPKELFQSLGGFDERYIPAYYEDTDLAFSVRSVGRRVIFQPFSQVIHHEGITSGTDTSKGVKAYQVSNQTKFLAKWETTLAAHGSPRRNIRFERERLAGKRVLIIDASTPTPDQDSGSIDFMYNIEIIQSLGYKITFAPATLLHVGRYTDALQRLGVECLYAPHVSSINEYIESYGAEYDLVILRRVRVAAEYIKQVRKCCSNAKIVFDTVDLHFLREERQAAIEKSKKLMRKASKTKMSELMVMRHSDATIVISDSEKEIIQKEWPDIRVVTIPYVREIKGCKAGYSGRRDIVFIGGFEHKPNIDAVLYFVLEIWPLVRNLIPEACFRIVGSKAPAEIKELDKVPGVIFEGYISDLDQVFNNCRVSVAPLRFGAGIKGKIGTSLSYGVPCVVTPLAAEGMNLVNQQEVLIASNPADFAKAIVEAYGSEMLWNRLSANGIEFMKERFSYESGENNIRELIFSLR